MTLIPAPDRWGGLRSAWLLIFLVAADASAWGQLPPLYAWRNLTGQPGGIGNADGPGSSARFCDPVGVATDGAGNVYVADSANHTIRKVAGAGIVTTLAGSAGQSGSADGTGSAALFNDPCGVAVDRAGNIYVADTGNSTVRVISTNGAVTTLAGSAGQSGSADGTGSAAQFNFPRGVAVDQGGNVYVADSANNTIRKVTPGGVVTTLAGSAGQSGDTDGSGLAALFYYPAGVAVDSAGNVYVADLDNDTIRKVTSAGVVTTLAGSAGQSGSADGTGRSAQFNYPSGVAADSTGNLYVADTGNGLIRKLASGGMVTTLAGNAGQMGSQDGTNNTATFDDPCGVAVDGQGCLIVADTGNNTIRQATTNGVVSTLAGSPEQSGSADVNGGTARFNSPIGVAVNAAGNLCVADSGNNTIRQVTINGVVTTFAGSAGVAGSADGGNGAARFNHPVGLAADSAGNLYVTDAGNDTVRKITGDGTVTTLAGSAGLSGCTDGTNSSARFNNPCGLAMDGAGNLYVADSGNDTIREVTSAGVVTTLAGSAGLAGSADGTNQTARFSDPTGVAVDGAGGVYVADAGNNTIRRVTDGVVATIAGSAGLTGDADGTNSAARFMFPFGAAVDGAGNVLVTDTGNATVRKMTPAGVVTTLAGSARVFGSTDGPDSAARFLAPTGLAVDQANNLFTADTGNSTIRELKDSGLVTTLAGGAGQPGIADDPAGNARYFNPGGVAVDNAGNLYVADTGNSTIRKVTSDGGVTTLAGSAGLTGDFDGTNDTARFDYPAGVATDSAGNVYVADTFNGTIRKVTNAGVVTTLAGSPGQFGYADGTGGAALFNYPSGVAVDGAGNIYVADSGNHVIRKMTGSGVVTTLAGSAGISGNANGTGAAARFNLPNGVAVDGGGNVYVADSGNNRVRLITPVGVVTTLAGTPEGLGGGSEFNFPRAVAVDMAGNVFVADTGNNVICKLMAGGYVITIGGTAGVVGGADGIGSAAGFAAPSGLAVGCGGRVYVADTGNNRIASGMPLPAVEIAKSAANVIVSWPAFFTNFALQQSPNPVAANGWLNATYNVKNDGCNNCVIISAPAGNQFFRLRAKE